MMPQSAAKGLTLSPKHAEILLVSVILARSTGFMFSKQLLGSMDTFNVLACRFCLGFVLMLILFHKKLAGLQKTTLLRGVLLGIAYFLVMSFELTGLKSTPSSTVAFLENCAVVLVPLFEAVLQRRAPAGNSLLRALIAMGGITLLTLQGAKLAFTKGELCGLMAAVCYTTAIICADRFSKKEDGLVLGMLQVGTMGFLSLLCSFVFETPHLPVGGDWFRVFYVAIVCTGFGYCLQPVAQRQVPSERTGNYCALGPCSAAVLGFVILKEPFAWTKLAGIALILFSLLMPNRQKQKT